VSPDREVAEVVAALRSPDAAARQRALELLAADPEPIPEAIAVAVIECLGVPAKAVQRRAADVLRATAAAARPLVLARLRDATRAADPCLRWGSTFALGQLGVLDPELVPPLLEGIADPDGDRRWAAAALLVACGRRFPEVVVPALLGALAGAGSELRKMALYALRDLAPGTPEVAAALVARMRDPDVGVRLAALSGLCRLEPLPPDACDLVLRALRDDPDPGLRRAAMSALGHVGRGVAAVADVLEAATRSDDPGLRRAAALARRRLAAAT
jgi:HEAT repeat protein